MAEMVASAVVGETLGRISSFLIDEKSGERDHTERLEMAHIKMEAALQLSTRWQITDLPMLRWRGKLKRAAQECDDALQRRKQRALEDEATRRSSSIPGRIAHAAKSFISSFSSLDKDDVRRFERFAEGTSELLKFVELGGTPRRPHMFFNPLIGDLLAGKTLRYQALLGGGSKFYYLGVRPTTFTDRGVEAILGFAYHDIKEPAKSFNLRLILRLSESTDIFGIIIKCMESDTPHFMATAAEDVRRELIQLPTQDFFCVTHFLYREREYWAEVHNMLTRWLRPDPLCCSDHEHDLVITSSNRNARNASSSSGSRRLACMYPEEVIVVYLQCHISLSDQQKSQQSTATEYGRRRSPNSGFLKLGVIFTPHVSPPHIEPSAESYAFEAIDGKEQEKVHINAWPQDVDEKLLPKAIDHLCQNSESKMYQMCLRSSHGSALICIEKTTTKVRSAGRTARLQSQAKNRRAVEVLSPTIDEILHSSHSSPMNWLVARLPPSRPRSC